MKASIDESKKDFEFEFNIVVPDIKIYNQLTGQQCNIYAFLRVVKDVMRSNNELDVNNLDLSANYISFFDKLEKSNTFYNDLINCKHITLDIINDKVNRYIGSFGTFHFCKEIVNKYGIVTSKDMNEVNSKYDDNLTNELLKNKLKSDALSLIKIVTKKNKNNKKKELMSEVFNFLAKVYGKPPINFVFNGDLLTPIEFKNKYIKNSMDEFVTITSLKKDIIFNTYSFIPNIYLNNNEEIIYLSINKMKEKVVSQLKDGVSVWFSAEESTTLDYSENILDDKLYNISNLLNIKDISKKKKMLLNIINYDHAMCITGALVKDNEIKQFRVDNSFGKHGKYKGQLIMTNSFFENDVITAIINKKYLD